MPPGVTQVDCNEARRLLAFKKTAMKIGTMWSITEVSGFNPDLHGWEVLEMFPIPQKEGVKSEDPIYPLPEIDLHEPQYETPGKPRGN